MRKNLYLGKRSDNGLKSTHVIAMPVTNDDVSNGLIGKRVDFGDNGLTHCGTATGIEDNDTPVSNDEDSISFLGQFERILPDSGPNTGRQLLPRIFKRVGADAARK